MRFDYDHVTNLEYKVRAQKLRIREFESGERYVKLKKLHGAEIRKKDSEIGRLKKELASANARIITNRNHFMEAMEDVLKEKEDLRLEMERKLKKEQEHRHKAEARIDEVMDRLSRKQEKLDEAYARIEELEGQITKLTAQVNCSYENSSKPSSQCPNHKKIENSREKSDRPRGAQPGHKGHTAKLQEPTEEDIWIPDPEEFTQNPDQYKPTGDYVYHQVVGLRMELVVQQYCANLFLNRKTRQYVHAPFPEWAANDVNYDGTVKALAFILNNYCNVSIDKTRDLLSEITGGKLTISKGMINSLAREFSSRSSGERDELFDRLVKSYALHTDFTTAKVNGSNVHVHLCGNEDGDILIQAREHKGHEGIRTPLSTTMTAPFITMGAVIRNACRMSSATFWPASRMRQISPGPEKCGNFSASPSTTGNASNRGQSLNLIPLLILREGIRRSLISRKTSTKTTLRRSITGTGTTSTKGCANTKTATFSFCTISGSLMTIISPRGLPGS